jgi:hypothetical protein
MMPTSGKNVRNDKMPILSPKTELVKPKWFPSSLSFPRRRESTIVPNLDACFHGHDK